MVLAGDAIYLERRPPSGIWGGLWSFPELDPDHDPAAWCQDNLHADPESLHEWPNVRHSFTHYDLDIMPVAITLQSTASSVADGADSLWHALDEPFTVGLAAPVSDLLGKLKLKLKLKPTQAGVERS
jgi:A/G-specific adenine glycosylase